MLQYRETPTDRLPLPQSYFTVDAEARRNRDRKAVLLARVEPTG